jgi:hypothetical protein
MKPRAPVLAPRLLQAAPWGQVSVVEPEHGRAVLVQELIVQGPVEPALALADQWKVLEHPSLLPVLAASVQPHAGAMSLRLEREAPRGSHLAEVFVRARPAEERMVAALFLDLLRAVQLCHARGLVAGVIAPESLFLCPPGQEQTAALRLHDAGLPQLVARAHGDGMPVGLEALLPTAEVVAPEVLAGQEPAPPSDVYALCATAAFCLLKHHVHAAATPALVRHRATQGLEPTILAGLLDAAPALGPLLARGLAVHPWGRAGVLAELVAACEMLLVGRVPVVAAGRRILEPWSLGSPLVPLAAYAGTQPFADRYADKTPGATVVAAVAGARQGPAGDIDAEAQAKLRAALQRLDAERVLSQKRSVERGRSVLSYVIVLVVFLLVAAAIVAIGLRQTRRFEDSLHAAEQVKPGEVRIPRALPPPVPPKPVDLN